MYSGPDKGYAWVVCLAATCMFVMVDGIPLTYGIVLAEISKHYGVSVTTASVVGSVIRAGQFFFGPFACGLNNSLGARWYMALLMQPLGYFYFYRLIFFVYRLVCTIGCILTATGSMLGPFMPNIWTFTVIYGALSGIGNSMMFVSSVVSVNQYFVKKRPLASALSFSGTCYGVIFFPPIFQLLLENYGWKPVLWVGSCIVSLLVALSTLFKPMTIIIENEEIVVTSDSRRPSILDFFPTDAGGDDDQNSVKMRKRTVSVRSCSGDSLSSTKERRKSSIAILRPVGTIDALYSGDPRNSIELPTEKLEPSTYNEVQQRPTMDLIEEDNTKRTIALVHDGKEKKVTEVSSNALSVIKEILDINFMRNPVMILISLVQFLFFILLQVPYMFLPMYLSDIVKLSSKEAMLMVPVLGVSNLLGRLSCGVIASLCKISVFTISTACMICLAISFFLLPVATTTLHFAILVAAQGYFTGPVTTLLPELLCVTFGLENLTSTLGICCVFRGFGALLGPPLIGYICHLDENNFSIGFTVAGGFMLFTMVMNVATQAIVNIRNKGKC